MKCILYSKYEVLSFFLYLHVSLILPSFSFPAGSIFSTLVYPKRQSIENGPVKIVIRLNDIFELALLLRLQVLFLSIYF